MKLQPIPPFNMTTSTRRSGRVVRTLGVHYIQYVGPNHSHQKRLLVRAGRCEWIEQRMLFTSIRTWVVRIGVQYYHMSNSQHTSIEVLVMVIMVVVGVRDRRQWLLRALPKL